MAHSVSFDTLEYSSELIEAGLSKSHAEAITKATAKAVQQIIESEHLATKRDIQDLKSLIHATTLKTITYISMIQATVITLCQYIAHN